MATETSRTISSNKVIGNVLATQCRQIKFAKWEERLNHDVWVWGRD
jgi:hypothetical protein